MLADALLSQRITLDHVARWAALTCLTCTDHVQVEDIENLGFATKPVSEVMFLLFKKEQLLQSRDQLWAERGQEVLSWPDPAQTCKLIKSSI